MGGLLKAKMGRQQANARAQEEMSDTNLSFDDDDESLMNDSELEEEDEDDEEDEELEEEEPEEEEGEEEEGEEEEKEDGLRTEEERQVQLQVYTDLLQLRMALQPALQTINALPPVEDGRLEQYLRHKDSPYASRATEALIDSKQKIRQLMRQCCVLQSALFAQPVEFPASQ